MNDEQLREIYARATAARKDPRRANCPTPEALAALTQRNGPEQQRLETLDHVMSCPECRQDFELLRSIEQGRRGEAGTAVRNIHWRSPLTISVVTALAAGLAMVAVLKPDLSLRRQSPDVMRGTTGGTALVAPAADTIVTLSPATDLDFTWRSVPGARRYILEVLTADGVVRATKETTDTTVAIAGSKLGAGDLRWAVRAETDGGDSRSATRRVRVNAR